MTQRGLSSSAIHPIYTHVLLVYNYHRPINYPFFLSASINLLNTTKSKVFINSVFHAAPAYNIFCVYKLKNLKLLSQLSQAQTINLFVYNRWYCPKKYQYGIAGT